MERENVQEIFGDDTIILLFAMSDISFKLDDIQTV